MDLHFDWTLIIVGLIFSAVGFVYFSYGKRTQSYNIMMCGMVLMVYTYFVDSIAVLIITGLVLSAVPFILRWW